MKKKKIIFLSYNLDIGGIERAVLNYIKYLDRSKYDIYLMLEKAEGIYLKEIPKDVKILNYNIYASKNMIWRKFRNFSKLVYFTIKYFNKFDFAACFATSLKSSSILAKRFSKNNAIWMHGEYWNNNKQADRFLKYINIDKYQKVVFVSEKIKNEYLKVRPNSKQKLYVINNMINYEEIFQKCNEDLNLNKNKTVLLNIGRHEENSKNLFLLIRTCARLLKEKYEFELWIIGDGPDHEKYINLVKKLKIEKSVIFYGKQSNVFPFYKKCDAVVMSSYSEGNPVVFLEAKVTNRPVITTDVSDAKKELEGYGIITGHSDEEFYNGLKFFLDNGYNIEKQFDPIKYNNDRLKDLYDVIEN